VIEQSRELASGASLPLEAITLEAMNCRILVRCQASSNICQAIHTAFAGMHAKHGGPHDMEFVIQEADSKILLSGPERTISADDTGDLLYFLDKEITLALQVRRRELCFVHAGTVVTPDGRAIVLAAASGSGKSTLTWALLHHGFRYMSDELAPIDPTTRMVYGYAHALCLKQKPPARYPLPAETLATSRTMHIPISGLTQPAGLAAIFFIDHRHPENHPILGNIHPARAALHLYANTLNPLAHPNDGLDAIATIAESVPCFEVNTADLKAACLAIESLLSRPLS